MTKFEFLEKPYKFQREAFKFGLKRKNAGMLLACGLGKTYVAINIARYRIQQSEAKKVLVVCPVSVILNWQRQIKRFSEYSSVFLNPNRSDRLVLSKFKHNKKRFGIINYESLYPLLRDLGVLKVEETKKRKRIIVSSDYEKRIKSLGYNMIIWDESARFIKNPLAQRTISAITLADEVDYKLILTGTVIANKPLDVWSQFRALDGGRTFGRNYYKFRNFFFDTINYGRYKKFILKREHVKLLRSGIYDSCIVVTKEEANLDLPPQIFEVIDLPLEGDLKNIYKRVEKEVISQIETEEGTSEVTIRSIFTKLLRLQQITAGFIKNDDGLEVELKVRPKLDAVIEQTEIVLDADESVIIWCRFIKSIEMIEAALTRKSIKCITMSGRDKGTEKDKKWKGFQRSRSINVFIGQVVSGGIGIELFKTDSTAKTQYTFYYENTWSLDPRQQSIDRPHRIGQNSTCVYKDFIIEGTIDEKIMLTLKENKQVSDMIMKLGTRRFLR